MEHFTHIIFSYLYNDYTKSSKYYKSWDWNIIYSKTDNRKIKCTSIGLEYIVDIVTNGLYNIAEKEININEVD